MKTTYRSLNQWFKSRANMFRDNALMISISWAISFAVYFLILQNKMSLETFIAARIGVSISWGTVSAIFISLMPAKWTVHYRQLREIVVFIVGTAFLGFRAIALVPLLLLRSLKKKTLHELPQEILTSILVGIIIFFFPD